MTIDLEINWGNLEQLLTVFDDVGADSEKIRDYANTWVCSKEGFDYDLCALKPIADVMPTLQGYFTDMQTFFAGRWSGVRDAVVLSAKDIDLTDGAVNHTFLNLAAGIAEDGGAPDVAAAIEALKLDPVPIDLSEPEKGGEQLAGKHDDRFQVASDTWDGFRDTINSGIDGINWAIGVARDAGVDIADVPKLPTDSLREMIVYPLSGNYEVIQRNGNACTIMGQAMRDWGTNFSLLSGKTTLALKGQASLGLIAQLNAYNLVLKAVGTGLAQGEHVYAWVAKVSEEIAIVVEKVMVKMSLKLAKVASRIGSKAVPIIGWVSLAWDIIDKGFAAITDIWNDIQELIQMIEDCKQLVDEVDAWAQVAADRLKVFEKILDLVEELPGVNVGGGIDSLKANLDQITKNLEDVPSFDESVSGAQDKLNDAIDDLAGLHPEDSGDFDDDDDDDDSVILAPGPFEGTYPGSGSGSSGGGYV